jgi:hypothetical protein
VADPSGEPDTFPTGPDIEAKFMTLCAHVLRDDAAGLFARLEALESLADIRELVR